MTAPVGRIPAVRSCPFAPPASYRALRESGPVVRVELPGEQSAWAVADLATVRALLTDPRVSSDATRPGFPEPFRDTDEQPESDREPAPLIEMDGEQHSHYRRLLIPEFSVRRINALRPGIQRVTDGLIDTMLAEGPGADLVSAFALAVPSLVICDLLGVPYAHHEFFQSRTQTIAANTVTGEDRMAAFGELRSFMGELVTSKRAHPTEDLLGRLVTEHLANGNLTEDVLADLGVLLLAAGFETTANMISLGALTFLANPGQLALLRARPELAANAADEMVRFHSLGDVDMSRIAAADLELAGRSIRAGEGIIPVISCANRDPAAFDRPDEVDIARPEPRHHVGFGYGTHQCLGQNLARAELEIAYRALFTRIPGLRLAVPVEDTAVKSDARIFGLYRLPITW